MAERPSIETSSSWLPREDAIKAAENLRTAAAAAMPFGLRNAFALEEQYMRGFRRRKEVGLTSEEAVNLVGGLHLINNEATAVILVMTLSEGENPNTAYYIRQKLESERGIKSGWVPGRFATESMLKNLETAGFIEKSGTEYSLTQYGLEYGVPLAGLLLSFSQDSKIPLRDVISLSPEANNERWVIFNKLLEGGRHVLTREDISSLGFFRPERDFTDLDAVGIITYKRDRKQGPATRYLSLTDLGQQSYPTSKESSYRQVAANILDIVRGQPDLTNFTSAAVAPLYIERYGSGGSTEVNLRNSITRAISDLLKHKYLELEGREGEVSLTPEQASQLKIFVGSISRLQQVDSDTWKAGVDFAFQVAENPDLRLSLLDRASDISSFAEPTQDRPAVLTQIAEIINKSGVGMYIPQLIRELRQAGITPDRIALNNYVVQATEAGLVRRQGRKIIPGEVSLEQSSAENGLDSKEGEVLVEQQVVTDEEHHPAVVPKEPVVEKQVIEQFSLPPRVRRQRKNVGRDRLVTASEELQTVEPVADISTAELSSAEIIAEQQRPAEIVPIISLLEPSVPHSPDQAQVEAATPAAAEPPVSESDSPAESVSNPSPPEIVPIVSLIKKEEPVPAKQGLTSLVDRLAAQFDLLRAGAYPPPIFTDEEILVLSTYLRRESVPYDLAGVGLEVKARLFDPGSLQIMAQNISTGLIQKARVEGKSIRQMQAYALPSLTDKLTQFAKSGEKGRRYILGKNPGDGYRLLNFLNSLDREQLELFAEKLSTEF